MKLQILLSKVNGKWGNLEKYKVDSCAYMALDKDFLPLPKDYQKIHGIIPQDYNLHSFSYFTNSQNLNDAKPKKDEKGKHLYFEVSGPTFRDINKFYQELFSMKELGLELCIKDSKLSEVSYDYKKWLNECVKGIGLYEPRNFSEFEKGISLISNNRGILEE
ncbi:MAG: hypothetical protein AABW67_03990 [Nanoarchaeota archaeon]